MPAAAGLRHLPLLGELNGVQGEPVDLSGYYFPDREKATAAMRPSPTFNAAIDAYLP